MGAGRSLAFSIQIEELATKSEPSPSPEDRNKGGLRHRRQAVDETQSREISFCVEHPTRSRMERDIWHIRSPTQPYLRSARACTLRAGRSTSPDSKWRGC